MPLEQIKILNAELSVDPLGRGYSGMSDAEAADDLNSVYRTKTVRSVPASAVLEATILAEYQALSDTDKALYQAMLATGSLDPSGPNTKSIFAGLFGAGTTTRANLLALSEVTVSRAAELLGEDRSVDAALVSAARSYAP